MEDAYPVPGFHLPPPYPEPGREKVEMLYGHSHIMTKVMMTSIRESRQAVVTRARCRPNRPTLEFRKPCSIHIR